MKGIKVIVHWENETEITWTAYFEDEEGNTYAIGQDMMDKKKLTNLGKEYPI